MPQNKIDQTNNLISVLLQPQFAAFSLSVIFSQVAANMLNIVLIILTYNLTHSNFAVSILIMTFLIPQILFSFLGGIIADAKNKRKILIFGNISRALLLLLFFFVKDSLALIYIFQLAIALVNQLYIPAEAPFIPHLVKKDHLLSANAIFGVCLFGSILVGYVSAGPALHAFGTSWVFIFMAGLFALAGIFVLMMPDVSPSIRKLRIKETFFANVLHLYNLVVIEFGEMLSIIRRKKLVASSFLFLSLSQVIILVLATIIPDYAQRTLHINAADISIYIFAPAALGMIASSLLIGSKFTKSSKETIIVTGVFLSSIVLFLFGVVDFQSYFNLVLATIILTFLAGVANACIFIPTQTIIQSNVDGKFLSKVYGLLYAVVGIMAVAPIILAGVFADVLGVRVVLLSIAVLLLGIGVIKIFLFGDKKTA